LPEFFRFLRQVASPTSHGEMKRSRGVHVD
jgi:hypothetical protein